MKIEIKSFKTGDELSKCKREISAALSLAWSILYDFKWKNLKTIFERIFDGDLY